MAGPNTSDRYTHLSNLSVGVDATIGNDLTVTGDASVTGDLSTSGNLTATGDIATGDDFITPGLTGDAIKFGDTTTSTYGYHDIIGYIEVRGVAATDPDWSQIDATPFYGYKFAIGDKVFMMFHIPHDYVPGTDIYLHTHWIPNGTDTNSVKWQYTYSFAKGHNQAAFNLTGTTVTAEQAGPGTQYQHMVTETSAITISGLEVDGLLTVVVERITNGGTDNTDDIFMFTSDVHYQSSGLPTANRAPNFYNT